MLPIYSQDFSDKAVSTVSARSRKMRNHHCKPTGQCKCNTLTRLRLRQELADTPRRHKKENRSCKWFLAGFYVKFMSL